MNNRAKKNFPIKTLSERQVAKLAGITVKELRHLASTGKGPPGEMEHDGRGNLIHFVGNPGERN
jgi:hypothetical protein